MTIQPPYLKSLKGKCKNWAQNSNVRLVIDLSKVGDNGN